MTNLCIRDLVEITGGRLQLGAMPPLGGELEPLGRVVVDCQQVRPGDVYWSLDRGAGDDAFPEEAFRAVRVGRGNGRSSGGTVGGQVRDSGGRQPSGSAAAGPRGALPIHWFRRRGRGPHGKDDDRRLDRSGAGLRGVPVSGQMRVPPPNSIRARCWSSRPNTDSACSKCPPTSPWNSPNKRSGSRPTAPCS